jgi:hypothetical protein
MPFFSRFVVALFVFLSLQTCSISVGVSSTFANYDSFYNNSNKSGYPTIFPLFLKYKNVQLGVQSYKRIRNIVLIQYFSVNTTIINVI